ncbi:hypothetical protein BD410DRAFT_623491 [Rickenella mellea]|uniref:Uncharacterized protein n=1 Tax=Rickenella mellea TaxID=50990 RepID=A0A4Y7PLU8_9AGAM|nr:hypothetical protein BD410DRAFT_623491 [Rickenella mellea]
MKHTLPAASVQRPSTSHCTPRRVIQHPSALIFEARQPFGLLQRIKTCSTVLVGDGGEEWKVASPARNDLSNPWTSISFRRSDTTKEEASRDYGHGDASSQISFTTTVVLACSTHHRTTLTTSRMQ